MTKTLAAVARARALPTLASASDINPGALQLSGKSAFDFGTHTEKDDLGEKSQSTLGGNLSAMYYVSKFLAFGLATEYDDVTTKYTPKVGTKSERTDTLFLFGPKAGIDYELMEHLSVFADATVGMAQRTFDTEKATGYGLEIGAGVKLFLNQHVSLDLGGAFKTVSVDGDVTGKVTDTGFGATIGLSLYLTNNPQNAEGYQPPPPPPAAGYNGQYR
jgi:opacity protein-like surface antigen